MNRFGVVPLRLFLGLTFIYAALEKIADPGYLDPTAGGSYIGNQLQQFVSSSPIGFLLQAVAVPEAQLVGVAVLITEFVVGVLVTLGVFTRAAASVGAILNLTLFLSLTWNIQPYFLAPDSLYTVAWITLALANDSGMLSLQAYVQRRTPAQSWVNRVAVRLNRIFARGQAILLSVGGVAVALIWLLAILPKNA